MDKTVKKKKLVKPAKKESRLFPFLIAGIICLILSLSGGYGAWYVFGSHEKAEKNPDKIVNQVKQVFNVEKASEPEKKEQNLPTPEKTPETAEVKEPETTPSPSLETTENSNQVVAENENKEETFNDKVSKTIKNAALVAGGEVSIGGKNTGNPVQREFVSDFFISQTEVTNEEYAEFIRETGYKSPVGWNKDAYPKNTGDFPVTNISYFDAVAYCEWLSKKLGEEVRLPTKFEWERAAKGDADVSFPWGNDWDKKAVASRETNGKVKKVKSFEKNKSVYGVYDLVGNVWEWTKDVQVDEKGKPVRKDEKGNIVGGGGMSRIIKGGSAESPQDLLSISSLEGVSEHTKHRLIGFRFVVVKAKTN